MKGLHLKRPTPSMAVALTALFVALSGSAFAAFTLPKNSVGTKQLRNGAVTGSKLHANAVTSGTVKDHTLGANDLRNGAVGANQLANGAVGARQLANGAVGTQQIINGGIGAADLANGAVGAQQLATGAVGTAQLADHAATSAKIADGAVGAQQLAPAEAWHDVNTTGEPTFQNSWSNAGVGPDALNAGFMRDQDGVVHLRGQIKGGTVGPATGVAFTLPAGDRPGAGTRYFPVLTTDGATTITAGYVAITLAGDVIVAAGDNHFVSLDNISFRP
jgi:hypothetical protein